MGKSLVADRGREGERGLEVVGWFPRETLEVHRSNGVEAPMLVEGDNEHPIGGFGVVIVGVVAGMGIERTLDGGVQEMWVQSL